MAEQYPVFVPVRDRLGVLVRLLTWLQSIGQHEIWLVDSMSSYPPLLDFLESTHHHVVRVDHNLGHRSPFLSGVVQRQAHGRFFIVTDPDVLPVEECPADVLDHFRALFDEHPDIHKVGFGLRIDDLPDHFALRQQVIDWERQFWQREIAPGVFRADIDTTFAMYRPLDHRHDGSRSIRTGAPYLARHLPWYLDTARLDDEERYYRERADPTISNWNREEVHRWKQRRIGAATTEPSGAAESGASAAPEPTAPGSP